jgi:signal transduction histidine kinase
MPDDLARQHELEANFAEALEREKLEAMAEFAAGAGHEINNPLTVIAGRAQLLLQGETDPERRHALALMNAQAMRVYEMIADMMLFARPPQPNLERFDAVKWIDALVADLQPQAARQETVLTRIGRREPCEIEADRTQLTVAVRALAQNAFEALGNGGRVKIEVQANGGELHLSVIDDGPGVSEEERRHVSIPSFPPAKPAAASDSDSRSAGESLPITAAKWKSKAAPGMGRNSR